MKLLPLLALALSGCVSKRAYVDGVDRVRKDCGKDMEWAEAFCQERIKDEARACVLKAPEGLRGRQ